AGRPVRGPGPALGHPRAGGRVLAPRRARDARALKGLAEREPAAEPGRSTRLGRFGPLTRSSRREPSEARARLGTRERLLNRDQRLLYMPRARLALVSQEVVHSGLP